MEKEAQTSEYYIISAKTTIRINYPVKKKSLIINRDDLAITSMETEEFLDHTPDEINARAILGMIPFKSLFFLLYVTNAEYVGKLDNKPVFKIKSVDFLNISTKNLDDVESKEFSLLRRNVQQLMSEGFFYALGFDLASPPHKREEDLDSSINFTENYTMNSTLVSPFKNEPDFISLCIYGNVIISEGLNLSDNDLKPIQSAGSNEGDPGITLTLSIAIIERYQKNSINFLDLLGLNEQASLCYFFKEVELLFTINSIKKFSYVYCQSSYPVSYDYANNSNWMKVKTFFEKLIANYINISLISFVGKNNVNRQILKAAYGDIKKNDRKQVIQKAFKIYDFYDYNTVDEFLNQLEIRTKQSSYGLCGNFNYEDLQTQKGVFWMANYEGDPTMNPNNFELAEKLSNNCLKNIFEFLGFSLSETVLNYTKKLFETYKGIDINTYNYINKKTDKERQMFSIGLDFLKNEELNVKNEVFKKKLKVLSVTWNCGGLTPDPNQNVPTDMDEDSEDEDIIDDSSSETFSHIHEAAPENLENSLEVNEEILNKSKEAIEQPKGELNEEFDEASRGSMLSAPSKKIIVLEKNSNEDNRMSTPTNLGSTKKKRKEYDLSPLFTTNEFYQSNTAPDIIMVGLQEMVKLNAKNILRPHSNEDSVKLWRILIYKEILKSFPQETYELKKEMSLVGILLLIFTKPTIPIKEVEQIIIKNGAFGTMGNKGNCVSIMKIYDSYIGFCTGHFTAGQKNLAGRMEILDEVLNLKLPSVSKFLSTNKFTYKELDIWFLIGDLNYRIDMNFENVMSNIKDNKISELVKCDQLTKEKTSKKKYDVVNEGKIKFKPTYKFAVGGDTYAFKKKKVRIPSYCDRILFKKNPSMVQSQYCSADVRYSDHRPVFGCFEIECKEIVTNFKEILTKKINLLSEDQH